MKNVIKSLLMLALVTIITACGGGGGGGSTADPSPANVSGTASKGIIKNGIVSIYGVTDGVIDDMALVNGITDDNGEYSLQLSNYIGPIVIEITASESSTMVCDVIDACSDGVNFGDDYSLSDDFSLKAIVPSITAGEAVTTNITPFTSMAAALAETSDGLSADSIQQANSQVASVFNITGDITALAVVDITNLEALASADSQAQKIAMLSSAILSAGLASDTGTSVGQVINNFVEDFADNNGQMVQNESNESADTSLISLEDIYVALAALLEAEDFTEVNLDTLKTTTDLLLVDAQQAESDSLTEAKPTSPEKVNAVEAAADLINSIRLLGLASTYTGSDEEKFLKELDTAAGLIEDDALDDILDTTSLAINAIANTYSEVNYGDENTLTSYKDEKSGLTVNIDGDVYRIDQSIYGTTVNLAATIELNTEETTPESDYDENWSKTIDAEINLEGSVKDSAMALSIAQGSSVELDLIITEDETSCAYYDEECEDEEFETVKMDIGAIDLDVTLTQRDAELPISFSGGLSFRLTDVISSDYESWVHDVYLEYSYNQNTLPSDCQDITEITNTTLISTYVACPYATSKVKESFTLSELKLLLSGKFSRGGESFGATLTTELKNPHGYIDKATETITFYDLFSPLNEGGIYEWNGYWPDEDMEFSEETAENYVDISLGLAFEFELEGVEDNAKLTITAERTGLETAAVNLILGFDAKRLEAEISIAESASSITITDQNSNVLTIRASSEGGEEGEMEGDIKVDGEIAATIEEENGLFTIRYNDGSFEIL